MEKYLVEACGTFKASAQIEADTKEEAEEKFLDLLHGIKSEVNLDLEQEDVDVY